MINIGERLTDDLKLLFGYKHGSSGAITAIHYCPLITILHTSDKALNTCYVNNFKMAVSRIVVNTVFAFRLWVVTDVDSSQDKRLFAESKWRRSLKVNHEYMLQLAEKNLWFEYNRSLCIACILVD